jgi:hypothetical protein
MISESFFSSIQLQSVLDFAERDAGMFRYAFQIAFLLAAKGRNTSTPASDMAKPRIVVNIRLETPLVKYNPKRTTNQPPAADAKPASFNSVGCILFGILPSPGLILRKYANEIASASNPTMNAKMPLPEEKYASPAVATVIPTMKSANALPCDFVAAMHLLLEESSSNCFVLR